MTETMGRFEHGGDMYGREGVIDFSANLNPLGMPAEAVSALRDHAGDFEAYPDAACRDLRAALADLHGVPVDRIVCTAGASDLIERICAVMKPETALVTAPCFSGYEQALERAGTRIVRHRLRDEDDFAITERILDEAPLTFQPHDGTDGGAVTGDCPRMLAFLCNPNNPTGLTMAPSLIERIVAAAADTGAVVVLDECFLDFTGEPSAVPLCERYPNLIVMRAFTKLYAMAGLRLGYGIFGDESLAARIAQAGQTWAVSTPAQVAGIAALRVDGWEQRTREYVDAERNRLASALEACGMRVIPGTANYLLFRSDRELYGPMLERGFLIRRCGNFEELDDAWYRIAVRTQDENTAFIAALQEVCR